MESKKKSEETAPLIEIIKKPETQTSPKLQRVKPLEKTALDLEDSSVLDLSVYNLGPFSGSKQLVLVYIRPTKENIDRLLSKGEERISYIFRGLTPFGFKKRFEDVLGDLEYAKCTKLKEEVFKYECSIVQKEIIYRFAEHLNKTLHH